MKELRVVNLRDIEYAGTRDLFDGVLRRDLQKVVAVVRYEHATVGRKALHDQPRSVMPIMTCSVLTLPQGPRSQFPMESMPRQ